ncbi:S24 family peptidase [Thalassomonas sp. RHCl1]|uniref:S24 family peptidase n=1 Tax=Thalassomonas sp. RHCl1 TaxID=2995320 RepID=UPI00248D3194|nr:S24 family peptidase [Thalassomonas sp. RHCl1]
MLKIIPFYAQAGVTGFESPAAEYSELALNLDQLLIDHPSATFIGQAQGHSMEGDGIFSGDLLIVSRAVQIQDQDIIVANLNGVFVCKKIDREKARLLSSSPGYLPYQLQEGDDFQVEGVVIRSVRLHRPLEKTL